MFLTLRIPWRLIDGSSLEPRIHVVDAGRYEVERIPNPFGFTNHPWIVLKGTSIGGPEAFWADWRDDANGDFSVTLEDTAVTSEPMSLTLEKNPVALS